MTTTATITKFDEWLAKAKPGEQFVYYTGLRPRGIESTVEERAAANAAWTAHKAGKVFLTQKRKTGGRVEGVIGTFDYIATRSKVA